MRGIHAGPRQRLIELGRQHGLEVFRDWNVLEADLLRHSPSAGATVQLLKTAVLAGVPQALYHAGEHAQDQVSGCMMSITHALVTDDNTAYWAVETIALALGRQVHPPAGIQRPPEADRTGANQTGPTDTTALSGRRPVPVGVVALIIVAVTFAVVFGGVSVFAQQKVKTAPPAAAYRPPAWAVEEADVLNQDLDRVVNAFVTIRANHATYDAAELDKARQKHKEELEEIERKLADLRSREPEFRRAWEMHVSTLRYLGRTEDSQKLLDEGVKKFGQSASFRQNQEFLEKQRARAKSSAP